MMNRGGQAAAADRQRLNLRTGAISQGEERLAGKAGTAEEHAHVARYKVIHAASRMIANRRFR
jgi:hypothetical protein